MRKSRFAGLVFLATATMALEQQPVEITSEPSHHLVLENEYVRVFDVTVAPKASTLIHRHNYDYLFVTLGDSDLINARVGEKPVPLQLKDGEVRFTPGNFAHAAINHAATPFHNITIELLKPSAVHECMVNCNQHATIDGDTPWPMQLYLSDLWTVSLVTLPPSTHLEYQKYSSPRLLVVVNDLDLTVENDLTSSVRRGPGSLRWIPAGAAYNVLNSGRRLARFVLLEFHPDRAAIARSGTAMPAGIALEKPKP
jgi:quercetin dioxygenase-like cupin family protein